MALTMLHNSLVLKNAAGDAYVELNDSGAVFNGNSKMVSQARTNRRSSIPPNRRYSMIQLKRVYDKREPHDGTRFLVERLWPRGVRKADVHIDGWQKEVGPSDHLRKWFSHE